MAAISGLREQILGPPIPSLLSLVHTDWTPTANATLLFRHHPGGPIVQPGALQSNNNSNSNNDSFEIVVASAGANAFYAALIHNPTTDEPPRTYAHGPLQTSYEAALHSLLTLTSHFLQKAGSVPMMDLVATVEVGMGTAKAYIDLEAVGMKVKSEVGG